MIKVTKNLQIFQKLYFTYVPLHLKRKSFLLQPSKKGNEEKLHFIIRFQPININI